VRSLQGTTALRSLSLVGPGFRYYTQQEEPAGRYVDLDFVVLLEPITHADLESVTGVFRRALSEYSGEFFEILYEDRIGPLARYKKGRTLIVLHRLLSWLPEYLNLSWFSVNWKISRLGLAG
jgi:hypothetical protein